MLIMCYIGTYKKMFITDSALTKGYNNNNNNTFWTFVWMCRSDTQDHSTNKELNKMRKYTITVKLDIENKIILIIKNC